MPPKDIINKAASGLESLTNNLSISTSPTSTFHSPGSYFPSSLGRGNNRPTRAPRQLKPFNTEDIKILLLENVNQTALDIFH